MRFKKFFFLSGLPRSGSTVLASILSQNPTIHVSPISILVGLFDSIRKMWNTAEHSKVFYIERQYENVLEGVMSGLYSHISKSIIIDKNRAWPHPVNIQLLSDVLCEYPKIICTVRDIAEILASFLRLIHKSPMISFVDKELINKGMPLTDENRCALLMSQEGHVFQAWSVLKWGFESPLKHCLHIIEYKDLVGDLESVSNVLFKLYEFLEIDVYSHNVLNIENKSQEEDVLYGLPGMHSVRKVLKQDIYSPLEVLGPQLHRRYEGGDFWR